MVRDGDFAGLTPRAPRGFGVAAIEDANDTKLAAFVGLECIPSANTQTHHRGLNVLIIGYERVSEQA